MRVIREWNHDRFKCTLFKHEMRYTLQIEDERLSVSYKMGDVDLSDLSAVQRSLRVPELNEELQRAFGALFDFSFLMDKTLFPRDETLPNLI
ncbi:MAG: hypothetical protein AAFR14_01975 [Bacteroidota bacterium]